MAPGHADDAAPCAPLHVDSADAAPRRVRQAGVERSVHGLADARVQAAESLALRSLVVAGAPSHAPSKRSLWGGDATQRALGSRGRGSVWAGSGGGEEPATLMTRGSDQAL